MSPRIRTHHHRIRCAFIGASMICQPVSAETYALAVQNVPLESHFLPRHGSPRATLRERWGALAVSEEDYWIVRGPGETKRRSKVTVGATLNAESPFFAELAVLAECQKSGAKTCRVVVYFTQCGFITVGVRARADDQYKYTHGHTAEEVMQACEEGGYQCDTPIGGCNTPME